MDVIEDGSIGVTAIVIVASLQCTILVTTPLPHHSKIKIGTFGHSALIVQEKVCLNLMVYYTGLG